MHRGVVYSCTNTNAITNTYVCTATYYYSYANTQTYTCMYTYTRTDIDSDSCIHIHTFTSFYLFFTFAVIFTHAGALCLNRAQSFHLSSHSLVSVIVKLDKITVRNFAA